jgi:hypothetical protein
MVHALVTIVVLAVAVMRPAHAEAASGRASDQESHAAAPAKARQAASSEKASHAAPAPKGGHATPAPATTHAAPAAARTEAAAKPVDKPATQAELVAVTERIHQRISEVTKAQRAANATSNTSSTAKAPARRERTARVEEPRVRLVWRIELAWPEELAR